jgi:hypothetical protein
LDKRGVGPPHTHQHKHWAPKETFPFPMDVALAPTRKAPGSTTLNRPGITSLVLIKATRSSPLAAHTAQNTEHRRQNTVHTIAMGHEPLLGTALRLNGTAGINA